MAELHGLEKLVLLVQAASAWFMAGLIWFVQVVHYPLYNRVGEAGFAEYERDHCALTTQVVAPVMVVELLSAFLLLFYRPRAIGAAEPLLGLVLLLLIWGATLFIADVLHGGLSSGFTQETYRALVSWNWLRTALWTIRGFIVAHLLWRTMI